MAGRFQVIGIIGQLDSRIDLERATTALDSQGSATESWTGFGTVWARAESLAGGESTNGNAREATRDYRFTVRHQTALAALGAQDRIVWGTRIFDILSAVPMPEGRPDRIIITARERA